VSAHCRDPFADNGAGTTTLATEAFPSIHETKANGETMRQRVPLNAGAVDLWAADETRLGKIVTGPAFERLVSEEYAALSANSGSSRLLTDAEVAGLRSRARANVLRRLQREGMTIAEDDPLESIRAEFATKDAGVGVKGALLHARAEVVLAAMGTKPTEESYLRVLATLDSEAARQAEPNELDEHLTNAELLSNAAEQALYERGLRKAEPEYEEAYIAEVTRLSRFYNLPHGRGRHD
jgi:hypothetical protein